jgi:hypothetical protein
MQSNLTEQERKLSRFIATRGVHSDKMKSVNCDVTKIVRDVVWSVRWKQQ